MQRKFLSLFMLMLLSCTSTHSWISSKEGKETYLYNFKLYYYKRLLIEGYNNTEEIKKIVFSDHSGFAEPILSEEDYDLIDSLVKIDNSTMIQDSVNRIGRVAEGAEGKHVFAYALNKYQSKWLGKLAKERYNLYIRKERQP